MKLRQAGEWKLVQTLQKRYSRSHPLVLIGMGDDTALIRASRHRHTLVTTDLLLEGIDFELAWADFRQIGYKAMAANLSDIASMGGLPRQALVALALPKKTDLASVHLLYQGLMDAGRKFDVQLIGGDTSASPHGIMITVMLIGEVESRWVLKRSGSRPGDRIFVTGTLGEAMAGLEILQKWKRRRIASQGYRPLIRKQLYPTARVSEGRLLATKRLATSMIDLSDGLSSDLHHLCIAGGVGATVYLDQLPVSRTLKAYAKQSASDPCRYALEGGEDFELLFTVRPSKTRDLERLCASGRLKAFMIGEITPKKQGIMIRDVDGKRRKLSAKGYQHFVS